VSAITYAAAVLTAVASHFYPYAPVPVVCHMPPGTPPQIVGLSRMGSEPKIWLRFCIRTMLLERSKDQNNSPVDWFAHEILHERHPFWSEAEVNAHEHAFGAEVLVAIRDEEFFIIPSD
jgi:hypothetical protein